MISSLRIHNVLILAIALLFCNVSHSQIVNFMQYGVENGLSQSQVNSLVQDNDGNLWVGTGSGVSKWNGIEFKNYYKSDSLAENWITASFKDNKGNLWFGHWGGSITRYDRITKQFQSIEVEKFSSYQEVTDFVEDTLRREIIFATKGSGIFVYNTERQKIRRFDIDSSKVGSRDITTLYLDHLGQLWVGTVKQGIYVLNHNDLKNDTAVQYKHITSAHGLSGNSISDIIEYDGKMWVGTQTGVNCWQYEQNELVVNKQGNNIIKIFDKNSPLNSDRISCFEKDARNNLWIGTSDKGLTMCVKEKNQYSFRRYSIEQGLNFYSVSTLLIDRENSLWIGTPVGLNQYESDYFTLYDESVGITNNIVFSVASDKKGDIWLGTSEGISQLIKADNIDNDSLLVGQYNIEGLSNVPVKDIFEDSKGNLWFATILGDLFKRSPKGSFEKINIASHIRDVIYSIAEDNDGNIWLGTRSGAAKITLATNKLTVYTEEDGLGGNNIYRILKGDDGTLWFAVIGGKLTSYDGSEFRVYDEKDGLNHQLILSLAKDRTGNIWLGCYTGGLYKYDGKEFTNYNKENSGMKSSTPYSISADNDNNIWFGTTYGVEKFNQKTNEFEHFGKQEGFLGIQVNHNATCVDGKGNVWFGTILGAVKYNPYVHFSNKTKPTIHLSERILLNYEDANMSFNDEYEHTENNLTFRFTGISLRQSDKLYYEFRMKNLKKYEEWRQTSERQVAFNNLKAKKYELEVVAVNADHIKSDPVSYKFEITVPFYDSYTFYIIQMVMIGLMLTGAVFFGRKTGGSRMATILSSIAIIIVFEYGINWVEDNLEEKIGQVAFIKVGLNALLGLILFPVEKIIKSKLINVEEVKKAEQE